MPPTQRNRASEAAVVIGGANVDVKARSTAAPQPRTSNPGRATKSPGGVARNIAENLARLGTPTHLVAAVGRDADGDRLLAQTRAAGVDVGHVTRAAVPTGTYTAVLDETGELVVAISDMAATESLGTGQVDAVRDLITHAGLLILDGNLAAAVIRHALDLAAAVGTPVVLEPVSVPKARLVAPVVSATRPIFAVTPNLDELAALTDLRVQTAAEIRQAVGVLHGRGVRHVWVRLAARGSLLSAAGTEPVALPAIRADTVDVTGAGDAALGAFAHALLTGRDPLDAARFAHAAAALTVESPHTVRPDLTAAAVDAVLADQTRSQP